MDKYKKIAMLMCSIGLMFLLTGVTYSFFNYTRTGTANSFETGTINFSIDDGESISLTNVFPMTASEAGEANIDMLTIGISGDTTYSSGEEFLISIVDVTKINNKEIPISYIATYTPTQGNSIGTESDNYFTEREAKESNLYLLNENGWVKEDKQVLVGFIKGGTDGINGTLTIKPYVDEERIAITDTPEANPEWVAGRTVFSTTEWNSLKGNNSISFKIKAESFAKLWVEEPEPDNVSSSECFDKKMQNFYNVNTNMTQTELSDCISYFTGTNIYLDNNGTVENFCLGTARTGGRTLQEYLYYPYNLDYNYLLDHNIINVERGLVLTEYDYTCGSDVVIPDKMTFNELTPNSNLTSSELNTCVNYFSNTLEYTLNTSNNETWEAYCSGTGTWWGKTLQANLDDNRFNQEQLLYLKNNNIVIEQPERKIQVFGINYKNYQSGFIGHEMEVLTSLVFNKSLRIIGGDTFYPNRVAVKEIIIPKSVEYIDSQAFMIEQTDGYNEINVGTTFAILGNPYIGMAAIPGFETITYGGTCQELYNNNAGNEPQIIYALNTFGQVGNWNVITTDTNTCPVGEAYL